MNDILYSSTSTASRTRQALCVLLISAAVLLAYYNALSNGYAYDDFAIVDQNPLIRDWRSIPRILTSGYWSSTGGSSGGLYRPFTILSYLMEYHIAGLNPALGHLDNVLLHFVCSFLVYLLVRRLAGGETAPLAAALLFAVHPVHVEAVANVAGRAELLASFFTLAGLYTFIRPPGRIPWYVVSPLMMFLGLISKETAVVLPLVICMYVLLYEREGRGRSLGSVAASLAPYALIMAVFLVMRISVLGEEVYPQGAGQVLASTKGYWRMLVMFKVFLDYMRLSFFPVELYSHYMLRPPDSILDPYVLSFLGIVGTLAAVSPRLIRTQRVYFFFVAWFFIALLPVSNIIPIGIMMAERSMYLPSVSICTVGGLLISRAASWTGISGRFSTSFAALLVLAVLASLGLLTHSRNKVWHDNFSVHKDLVRSYRRVIANFPESGDYYRYLARSLHVLGQNDEAIDSARRAIDLDPGDARGHMILVMIYEDEGKNRLALPEARIVASMDPELRPVDYAQLAEVLNKNGLADEAGRYAAKAMATGAALDHEALADIAKCLYNVGMYDGARRCIERAIRLDPFIADYHLIYAEILLELDGPKSGQALEELEIAESLDKDLAQAHYLQGIILGRLHEYRKAAEQIEKAERLLPDKPEIRYYLGAAYIALGRDDDAIRELQEALRLKPDYTNAQRLLDQRQ